MEAETLTACSPALEHLGRLPAWTPAWSRGRGLRLIVAVWLDMAPKAKSGSAKKPAGGGSSTKAAAFGGGGSEETRWLQAQIAALAGQREAAAREGNGWIEEPHTWHEQRLEQLAQLLEAGSVTSLPSELREGVEFYVSQLAGGDVDQDSFYDDRDVYGDIFDRGETAPAPEGPPYERPVETPEAEAAVAQVREWDNVTMQGIAKLERLLKEFAASPGVQEAGITRISALVAGSKDGRQRFGESKLASEAAQQRHRIRTPFSGSRWVPMGPVLGAARMTISECPSVHA